MASRSARIESVLLEGIRALDNPAAFEHVFDVLGKTFDAAAIVVFAPFAGANSAAGIHFGWGQMRDGIHDHAAWVWKIDLWTPELAKLGVQAVNKGVLSHDLVPRARLVNSAFYSEHLRLRGQLQHMMSAFVGAPQERLAVAMLREGKQCAYATADLSELQKLKFQLEAYVRAYEASRHLAELQHDQSALLNAQSSGLLTVDVGGAILVANASARMWLGLSSLDKISRLNDVQPVLWEACLDARQAVDGTLTVSASGRGSSEVRKVVIEWRDAQDASRESAPRGQHKMRAFLRIEQIVAATFADKIERFALVSGLSVMETAVLRHLVESTPTKVALKLGLKISTVRSHMSSIFMKTGKSRQSDLLWALATA